MHKKYRIFLLSVIVSDFNIKYSPYYAKTIDQRPVWFSFMLKCFLKKCK